MSEQEPYEAKENGIEIEVQPTWETIDWDGNIYFVVDSCVYTIPFMRHIDNFLRRAAIEKKEIKHLCIITRDYLESRMGDALNKARNMPTFKKEPLPYECNECMEEEVKQGKYRIK